VAPPSGSKGSHVTYITSGGAGAGLYGVERSVYHASAEKKHHFCIFDIAGDRLTMDAIDIDGNIIDHLKVTKTDGGLDREYLATAVPMAEIAKYQKAKLDKER
jgi:hypothetical protein